MGAGVELGGGGGGWAGGGGGWGLHCSTRECNAGEMVVH